MEDDHPLARAMGIQRMPDYSWASEEHKKETMFRGFEVIEEAHDMDLVEGQSSKQKFNWGIQWVGDDQDNEKARFLWRYYLEVSHTTFRDLSQFRELDGFNKERDQIQIVNGSLCFEFRSEAFDAEVSPKEVEDHE